MLVSVNSVTTVYLHMQVRGLSVCSDGGEFAWPGKKIVCGTYNNMYSNGGLQVLNMDARVHQWWLASEADR